MTDYARGAIRQHHHTESQIVDLTAGGLTQSQTDALYQPVDSDLTAIAALTTTSYGRSLLAAADAAGLQTLAGVSTFIKTLLDDADAATARTTLGVTTGTTQAFVGYNTVGGTTETPGVNSKLYFKKVTLANACLVSSVDAYVGTSGAGAVLSPCAAVYDDNAGSPGKVIAYATEFNTVSDMGGNFRWLSMPIGAWLSAADYWLAIRHSDSGGAVLQQIKYDGSGSDRTGTGVLNTWKDASLYTLADSTNRYSIRANTIR